MPVLDSVKQRVSDVRERRPVVDHLVRAVEHYGQVNGSALAAAVTYFAFLSFFPILALAFAIFGQVTKVYEDAQDTLVDAANSVLPGLVGGENGVPLDTLQAAAPGIFSVGILLTLYAGLGWLSGMRTALMTIFEEPEREQPNFLIGKLRDVLALLALGSVLVDERGGVRRRDQGAHPDHGVARPRCGGGGLLLGAGPVPGPGGQHGALLRLLPPARAARTSPAGRCGPARSWVPSCSRSSSSSPPSCSRPRPSPRRSRPSASRSS